MRLVILLILVSSNYFFSSCEKIDENRIVGNYAMDKFRFRDSSIKIDDFVELTLQSNKTFYLKNQTANQNIEGLWNVKDYNSKEISIEFKFNDKMIEGKIKGNIFYFEYPNEFHLGRYDEIKYIKTIQ